MSLYTVIYKCFTKHLAGHTTFELILVPVFSSPVEWSIKLDDLIKGKEKWLRIKQKKNNSMFKMLFGC